MPYIPPTMIDDSEGSRLDTFNLDEKYYEAVGYSSLAERLMIRARDRIYEDFIRLCKPAPQNTILDVGISDVVREGANVLEKRYRFPDRITAAGLGTATDFRRTFPTVKYVQIQAGKPLPFADGFFDLATANAVLEHVGSSTEQQRLVSELVRVSRRVFITVPHRLFPVEHHTAFPIVHYCKPAFRFMCSLGGKRKWSEESNLILMTKARLRSLVSGRGVAQVGYTGLRLGPFSSNLYLYIQN
jgi:methyltransferase family protein